MCPIVKLFYESDRSVILVPIRANRSTKLIDGKIFRFKLFTALKLFCGSTGYIK